MSDTIDTTMHYVDTMDTIYYIGTPNFADDD